MGDPAALAQEIAALQWHYARRGEGLARAALAGSADCVEGRHYPRQDAVDATHGTRFYYHAHAAEERAPGEHGHFHLFVPAAGDGFSHLAGLSLDAQGLPLRWFTTNQWVTGETWTPAHALREAPRRFRLAVSGRLAPVARWLQALVRLYADDLADLIDERDARLAEPARRRDRTLHITSQRPVSLLDRLQAASHA